MKIQIDISDSYEETFVTIHTNEWTEELESIVKTIQRVKTKRLLGYNNDQSILLNPNEIDYVFAENRRIFATIKKQNFELKMKLFEVESLLEQFGFTKLSKSVIGNLNQIEKCELSI